MHLRFSMMKAYYLGEMDHPQTVMKSRGITYQHATPQSLNEQWLFWNCENIPDELPEYLSCFYREPIKYIGRGLSKEDAIKISEYKPYK